MVQACKAVVVLANPAEGGSDEGQVGRSRGLLRRASMCCYGQSRDLHEILQHCNNSYCRYVQNERRPHH